MESKNLLHLKLFSASNGWWKRDLWRLYALVRTAMVVPEEFSFNVTPKPERVVVLSHVS